ncbi:MAG: hypothetical protein ACI9DH_000655 [Halioglobus sp.]|jgi:uncharacterized protein (DUF924 family)
MAETASDILNFWVGALDENGLCNPQQQSLWFKASADTDQHCKEAFGIYVEKAISGELNDWVKSDEGLVALVILLDQFTRNIYRGTPAAFSGDARALELAQHAIASGQYQRLPAIHRLFLCLPLEHTENPSVQECSVERVRELAETSGHEMFSGFIRYAVAHRNVIAQFGRFPHRNSILGRESTREELDYLAVHGGF